MRPLVVPEFTSKVAHLPPSGVQAVSAIVDLVRRADGRAALEAGAPGFAVRPLGETIVMIEHNGFMTYATQGTDSEGEFLLFLDLVAPAPEKRGQHFAARNPQTNSALDPNRNTQIDPRRNMLVDPQRNMMIDPNRNMMIDPRRNMVIDPQRNMMIDPNRNMMIDPRRNMMLDPQRNMMIDPRRNMSHGGPYLYTPALSQVGFVVRANDKVSLVFDIHGRFDGFYVSANDKVSNLFDVSGNWIGFLVNTEQQVLLRFDTSGRWEGTLV